MNTELTIEEIKNEAWKFDKITLPEMDGVKLMDRVDVKYVVPLKLLPQILSEAKNEYKLLEVNNERLCLYETLYYDTPSFDLYHNHHNGRGDRYKIRFRNYAESNVSYFEIKHKNNKGRTLKTRIKQPNQFEMTISGDKADFLKEKTPLTAAHFEGNLWVYYRRMTLVNKIMAERVTIDINLSFKHFEKKASYYKVAIIEVKQKRQGTSSIVTILKNHGLRPGSISKYCLGVLSTQNDVKINRFKRKFLYLKKIVSQHDALSTINH